jgi:glutathione S-transferase
MRVKLYSENSSPFSAAVRLSIYVKGLDIEIVAPPGGLLSARFHAINPVGTIPCLMLPDEMPLSESAAILEYLEDRYHAVPLLSGTPEQRARTRLIARIAELGILMPLTRLGEVGTDQAALAQWLTRLIRGLASLNHFLAGNPRGGLTLADCFIAPALFLLPHVLRAYGKEMLLDAYPDLQLYLARLGTERHVQTVWTELGSSWR